MREIKRRFISRSSLDISCCTWDLVVHTIVFTATLTCVCSIGWASVGCICKASTCIATATASSLMPCTAEPPEPRRRPMYSNTRVALIIQSPARLMMVITPWRKGNLPSCWGCYWCAVFPSQSAGPDPRRPPLSRVLDLWATLQERPGDVALLVLWYWISAA